MAAATIRCFVSLAREKEEEEEEPEAFLPGGPT